MKEKLQISRLCFAAVALLILIFPFRTATLKYGKIDSSASLGPTFILSNPSKSAIFKAVVDPSYKGSMKNAPLNPFLQSEVDYGRTILLMLPFAVGAVVSHLWLRKIQE